MQLDRIYAGKRVLVTGNTGFKGSWLTQWLRMLGAEVFGYALEPPTSPSLFEQLGLADEIRHELADVRDRERLTAFVAEARPDAVFHLAAQPIVRTAYEQPVETVEVNTMGTANLLEAVRSLGAPVAVVVITTDKCYENREWEFGYRENDAMGGHDVYSASKGAAELLVASWRSSFFPPSRLADHGVRLASVRAGNVIGGGDWARDRILPDCIRALLDERAIELRNPAATRPWQHVLEPLAGYLHLAARMLDPDIEPARKAPLCSGFNFGPQVTSNRPVSTLTDRVVEVWGSGSWKDVSDPGAVHEANLLHLSTDKAFGVLGWTPRWGFDETVEETVGWYRDVMRDGVSAKDKTMDQIRRSGWNALDPAYTNLPLFVGPR